MKDWVEQKSGEAPDSRSRVIPTNVEESRKPLRRPTRSLDPPRRTRDDNTVGFIQRVIIQMLFSYSDRLLGHIGDFLL